MDKDSRHQKVRRRRSRRRFADPLSTIILKDAQYSLLLYQPERIVSICHSGITLCSSGQGTTSGLATTEKAASVKCLDAVLGKVHLPCWRFIFVRHDDNVHRDVLAFCSSDESPPSYIHSSKARLLQGIAGLNPIYVQSGPLRHIPFSLGLSSAGVAQLLPCSRKLLDETVKILAVSHLLLLDCDDSCMLSVPSSTSDLHYSRWQSSVIYQVLSTEAFTLLCHAF